MTDPFDDLDEEFEAPLDEIGGDEPEVDKDYTFVCLDIVKNKGRESGVPKFEFTFRLVGRHPDDEPKTSKAQKELGPLPFAGWEGAVHCSLSNAALWKLAEVLEAMTVAKPGKRTKFTRQDVIGRLVIAHIEEDEFQGRTRAQISYVGKYTPEPGKQIDVDGDDDIPF